LVEFWAFGDSGDLVLNNHLTRLRRMTNYLVRADTLPAGERMESPTMRLVPAEEGDLRLSLATAESRGGDLPWSELQTLARFREDRVRIASPEEKELTRYVAGFLQPNCLFDEELTRLARARRVDAIQASDRYEAGQTIVRQGEVITPQVKRTLSELRARIAAERAQATAAVERVSRQQVEAEVVAARVSARASQRMNRWLLGMLIGVGTLCLWVAWRAWRGLPRGSRHGADPEISSLAVMSESIDETAWRRRALLAEARAEKASSLLRSSLLPHLARWMSNELVQRLLLQRSEILSSQQKAEKDVADLVERLDHLQAPLEDRLRAYQERIAELETELAAKGEQNVELIKAKIETTRKRLEGERSQDSVSWN
jgi:hypothetical protein